MTTGTDHRATSDWSKVQVAHISYEKVGGEVGQRVFLQVYIVVVDAREVGKDGRRRGHNPNVATRLSSLE